MNESLMKSALKKICCGKMKEHIDIYENIDSYNKLRNDVMDYALNKLRDGGKTTTNTGMDLSAVMKEIEERLSAGTPGYHEAHDYGNYHPGGKGGHDNCGHDHGTEEEDPNVKFADALMAMFKGKGKGKGKGTTCWTCGQQGHIARNCPKGAGKGFKGKGQFNGTCHNCGKFGHRAAECRSKGKGKGKGYGKGLNEMHWGWTWTGGTDNQANQQAGKGAEANLGGGKGAEKCYYDNNGNWVIGEIGYEECLALDYEEKKQRNRS